MSAVAQVQDVRKRYGSRQPWAVDGVSLSVAAGEAFGLLGPNGAGKTSIVKMLAGLTTPIEGSVRIFGADPLEPGARARLGYAPEEPDFPKFLRGDEVLDYFGRLCGLDAGERAGRAVEALGWAGLGGERRQVRQYSKGMKQRLGLAQALITHPQLLILDEPTSDLDPLGRRAVRDLIVELKQHGTAVLLNSHLLSEVEMVCDRVAIINRGKLVREGTVHELVPAGKTLEDVFIELFEGDRPTPGGFVGGWGE
ncbi:MAG: type transport system ATP-binding protein [Chloroflexota bacterium]|jgi:ABC-2 type transport system ATP-binding protein|nr:type transport system ATP-binding protein [Chloroflexota bacterium]